MFGRLPVLGFIKDLLSLVFMIAILLVLNIYVNSNLFFDCLKSCRA